MHFSHQQVSRLGLPLMGVAIAALAACTPSEQSSTASTKAVANPASAPSNTSSTTLASANPAKSTAKEQFTAIIGSQQDGWLPKVLAGKGLKKDSPLPKLEKLFLVQSKCQTMALAKSPSKMFQV